MGRGCAAGSLGGGRGDAEARRRVGVRAKAEEEDAEEGKEVREEGEAEEGGEEGVWELDWDSLTDEQAEAIEEVFLQEFGEEGIEELTRSLDDTELASLPVWVKGRGWVYPEDLDEDDDSETSATPESRAAQISLRHMDNVLLDEENQPDVAAVAVPRGSAASLEAPSTSEPVRGGAAKKEPSTAAAASVLRNGTTLDAWQLAQLQSALATHGRRGVEVAKLAKRLGLQRNDVLAWLKDHGNAAPRMAGDAEPDAAGAARAAERAAERAKAAAAPEPHDWRASRASFGAGRLKARQVATLDAVFAVHAYPSTAVLRELARRTRLPHWRVALWFTERRGARRASPPPPR